ncbi:aminotransferase [Flavobacterium noncentrifugens]|uniref:Methionine aminotransferase n=1 Tax=Flavobacterium noncentrifugens TaxID=1128970 RepID=A0A1G8VK18_9FLAO|nr:methionine aminotransferase [Flavobacterium noncentrifugens]GEP50511.1 aminotransferase [Flavobacterium noncentrifugens]SDJ65530.1 methionine aminotransferase [Flavobacterium noncentrifugens]
MSKFPDSGESIFTTMSKMANEYQAINLSQGFPDFPADEKLTNIVAKIAKQNIHQYLPFSGYLPLLEKIATLTLRSYQRLVDPVSEILVTAGATQGIFTAIQALVNTNDEVIILDPSYDCYTTPIVLVHAKPVRIALNADFTPDWNAISDAMNQRTKMIILNNPHNPSGKIWSESDFLQLEKLLELFPEVLILADEVYEYIAFGNRHISVHSREKLKNRSIVISSFGKTFHITGWKIGYAIAPAHLMQELKKLHQFLVFSVNSIAQVAIAEYLDIVAPNTLYNFYEEKRNGFRSLLATSRFSLLPCEGTYFQVASYAAISNENDLDFTKRLIVDYGVAAIPLSVFYENKSDRKLIRFCFAKKDETLEKAAERLIRI